jgi:hypothetical protein
VIDFAAAKAATSLEDVASRYTKLNRSLQGPCPLCADGGRDRFYILKGGDRCGCRRCEFSGDVIDLVAAVERISKAEAVRFLTGKPTGEQKRPILAPRMPVEAPAPSLGRETAWDAPSMRQKASRAADALAMPNAAPIRKYLQDRGLSEATWQAFGLGWTPSLPGKSERPRWRHDPGAVVIPWIGAGDKIEAIKYRVVNHAKIRYMGEPGGRQHVFGAQVAAGGASGHMLVVEGEFNAMSAWQVLNTWGVDVVSIGSESNRAGLEAVREMAAGRKGVLVWMDKPDLAVAAAKAIKSTAPVVPMQSPGGKDASDILVEHGERMLREVILRLWSIDPFGD